MRRGFGVFRVAVGSTVVVVAAGGSVVFLEFPGFGEIVAFAVHTGKGDSHQQQGEYFHRVAS